MIKVTILIIFVISIFFCGIAEANDPNLVGWWKFDDSLDSSVDDSSLNGNNGILFGNTTWVTGRVNGALKFDGVGDYVSVVDNVVFNISSEITIAAWIRADKDTDFETVISKGSAWKIQRYRGYNEIVFSTNLGQLVRSFEFDGKWHHLACTYDGTEMVLYIDGAASFPLAVTGELLVNNDDIYIGKDNAISGSEWNGLIDDVRLFNRALSTAEITEIADVNYTSAWNPLPEHLAGIWADSERIQLQWNESTEVDSFNVYLGTNFIGLLNANELSPEFVSNSDVNSFSLNSFTPGTQYFWRIDQLKETNVTKGEIWQFRVGSYRNVPSSYGYLWSAVNAANNYDIIVLANGTYTGSGNRDLDFISWEDVFIKIKSLNGPDHCTVNCGGSAINQHRFLRIAGFNEGQIFLDGVTLTGGYQNYGGSINIDFTSVQSDKVKIKISNCRFAYNEAQYDGGAIYISDVNPEFENCTFENNNALTGGALYIRSGADFRDCTFRYNSSQEGGAIRNYLSTIKIFSCIFNNNTASLYSGGAILNFSSNINIKNCLFYKNHTTDAGGALRHKGGTCEIANSTFYQNSSTLKGGGVNLSGINHSIINSILWENSDQDGYIESSQVLLGNLIPVSYTCISQLDCLKGNGNISSNPLFFDPNSGDFHLKSAGWRFSIDANEWIWDDETSRCIDAGNPGMELGEEPVTLKVDPLNRWGENLRINMGMYGGTTEASIAPPNWSLLGDLTNDGIVDFFDYAFFAQKWFILDTVLPADLNKSGTVDFEDISYFSNDWLKKSSYRD